MLVVAKIIKMTQIQSYFVTFMCIEMINYFLSLERMSREVTSEVSSPTVPTIAKTMRMSLQRSLTG